MYEHDEETQNAPSKRVRREDIVLLRLTIFSELNESRHTEDEDHQQEDANGLKDFLHSFWTAFFTIFELRLGFCLDLSTHFAII